MRERWGGIQHTHTHVITSHTYYADNIASCSVNAHAATYLKVYGSTQEWNHTPIGSRYETGSGTTWSGNMTLSVFIHRYTTFASGIS